MSRLIVTFDASTPRSVVVLGERGDAESRIVAHDVVDDRANQASARLAQRIDTVVRDNAGGWTNIEAIGVGCGPGTFTGTRVAIATAQGLALGTGRPVIAVSTLAAIAASAERTGSVLAIIDARRGEVYGGWFSLHDAVAGPGRVPASVSPERCATLEALFADAAPSPDTIVIGSGVEPYRDAIPAALRDAAIAIPGPQPTGLWAATVAAADDAGPPHALQPVYLRQSYAELGINQPKRKVFRSPFV